MQYAIQETVTRRQLEAVLPRWCALKWQHTVVCGLFVGLFLYLSYVPVSDPATWRDVAVGQLTGRANMSFVDRVPLADGIRSAETGWASKMFAAKLHQLGGPQHLSLSFAILQTCSLICWAAVFWRLTKRWFTVFGALIVFVGCHAELAGFGGIACGQLALALMFVLLISPVTPNREIIVWSSAHVGRWIGVSILFVVWANLHASFIVGWGVLLCLLLDYVVTYARRAPITTILDDREFKSRVYLLELTILATLFNPAGTGLWRSMFWWPDNPFVVALGGWSPTPMAGGTGCMLGVAWFVWFCIARRMRRIAVAWTIIPIIATISVACCQASMVWFVPLMVTSLAVLTRLRQRLPQVQTPDECTINGEQQPVRFAFTLVAALILWVGFCLSPLGVVFGGRLRDEQQTIGKRLPINAREFLSNGKTNGIVFCPTYWADYIMAYTECPIYMNHDTCRVPSIVATDYERIYRGVGNWNDLAKKYAIGNMLIDKRLQSSVARQIRRGTGGWHIAYEDDQTIVARRTGGKQ